MKAIEYLRDSGGLVWVLHAYEEGDQLNCEFIFTHPNAPKTIWLESPEGDRFHANIEVYIGSSASHYLGDIVIKRCLIIS